MGRQAEVEVAVVELEPLPVLQHLMEPSSLRPSLPTRPDRHHALLGHAHVLAAKALKMVKSPCDAATCCPS